MRSGPSLRKPNASSRKKKKGQAAGSTGDDDGTQRLIDALSGNSKGISANQLTKKLKHLKALFQKGLLPEAAYHSACAAAATDLWCDE